MRTTTRRVPTKRKRTKGSLGAQTRKGASASICASGAGGGTKWKGRGNAPNPTYDKCLVGREELLQLAAAVTLNARDRVHQAGLDERVGINVLALFDGIGCVAQSLQ